MATWLAPRSPSRSSRGAGRESRHCPWRPRRRSPRLWPRRRSASSIAAAIAPKKTTGRRRVAAEKRGSKLCARAGRRSAAAAWPAGEAEGEGADRDGDGRRERRRAARRPSPGRPRRRSAGRARGTRGTRCHHSAQRLRQRERQSSELVGPSGGAPSPGKTGRKGHAISVSPCRRMTEAGAWRNAPRRSASARPGSTTPRC